MAETRFKNLTTGKVVTLVLIAVLVAAVTILVIQNLGLRGKVEDGMETAEQLTAEIDDVERQVNEYKFALETKDLEIEKKEEMLLAREELIKEKETKIADLLNRNRISQQEAERLRGRVETLEYYVKMYEGKIDKLKTEIAVRDSMIASLSNTLGDTKEKLGKVTDVNIRNSVKLKVAEKLVALNFKFYRLKQSGAAVEESEFRSSQMDAIKICMGLAANSNADSGERDVYLRIMDPVGKLVKDDAKSGYFKFSSNDILYTAMAKVSYENEGGSSACISFDQPKGYDYEDGTYKVLAYCEDHIIGKSEFVVK